MASSSTGPNAPSGEVDPLGPIFLSYRTSDGQANARALASALRAFGLPIWHDEEDLPPGDIERRVAEAMESGLSGAVLLVTDDVGASQVIRDVELPHLLHLETCSDFTLAVANALIEAPAGSESKRDAADRLLGLEPGTLRRLRHYAIESHADFASIAHALALRRMELYRRTGSPVVIEVSLQTRAQPHAYGPGAGLVIRTQPPSLGRRAPDIEAWSQLQRGFAALPELIAASGARSISLTGPAHLSIAYAFGAALPVTAGHPVTVVDATGGAWTADNPSIPESLHEAVVPFDAPGQPLAVFVDLAHTPPAVDTFSAFLETRRALHAGQLVLTLQPRRRVAAATGCGIVAEAANRIHEAAARFKVNRLALFLRIPFPAAVLLGQLLNTLTAELYEWEDAYDPPGYIPMATVACGRGNSPIIAISEATSGGE